MLKKLKFYFAFGFCMLYSFCFAQISTQLAPGIDQKNKDLMEVFEVWKAYLANHPDQPNNSPNWNLKEKDTYISYDLLHSHGFLNPGLYAFQTDNVVLYIKQIEDCYIIYSQFYWLADGLMNPLAITKVVAKKDDSGKFKLHNWLPIYTKNWTSTQFENLNYIYPSTFNLKTEEAKKANQFVNRLNEYFDIEPKKIDYYIFEDCDHLFQSTGFEYVISMGSIPNRCAFFDDLNRIVYTTRDAGVFHKHELIHLINTKYPKAHPLLLSGLSVYTNSENSSMGKPFLYHVKILNHRFTSDPTIKLTNWNSLSNQDSITEPFYFLGAILCDLILEKGGLDLLKKALASIQSDDDLLHFAEAELGYSKANLNTKMKERFEKIALSNQLSFHLKF
ncbi:MAG: hypothetical protein LAT51_11780 [Flavobacteriaceae bacterium]|nr:hypothetical protein [Flavobacteriaceae bacterium]